ncbi:MAG: D-inositol 3-phosphate glycosyltransferase [bacterium ADurb.Bin400]|nr:MAG: D-inositol 3-phosphate glycosyltransferase [bacterium ADurb.Bin400]
MDIGVDISGITSIKRTGVENMSYQFLLHLLKLDKTNRYYLYTRNRISDNSLKSPNTTERFLPFPRYWHKLRLPIELLLHKPDIFLAIGYMVPFCSPKKTIVFIHDLAFRYYPEAYSAKELFLQEYALNTAIKHASKLICVSESTRKDLIKFCNVTTDKTTVIHLAHDNKLFRHSSTKPARSKEKPYVLFVGRLESRKNVVGIIKAFARFKKTTNLPHKLVLVGKPGHGYDKIENEIVASGNIRDDIVVTGYVSNSELANLYSGADAFVFPTLYEGFGIPILEAMASGTPVITSTTSSMPEVAGDAAVLVDPTNISDITDALNKLLTNPALKKAYVAKGLERAQQFSWDSSASKLLSIINEL